jgi:hypothetical protein
VLLLAFGGKTSIGGGTADLADDASDRASTNFGLANDETSGRVSLRLATLKELDTDAGGWALGGIGGAAAFTVAFGLDRASLLRTARISAKSAPDPSVGISTVEAEEEEEEEEELALDGTRFEITFELFDSGLIRTSFKIKSQPENTSSEFGAMLNSEWPSSRRMSFTSSTDASEKPSFEFEVLDESEICFPLKKLAETSAIALTVSASSASAVIRCNSA